MGAYPGGVRAAANTSTTQGICPANPRHQRHYPATWEKLDSVLY
nr:uncharacterized protein CTRU02_09911 [Colletotrichum truncatum]KAF6788098.1 hypothetical protein CTRU02_09911 [Colletotrichum truncatum]